MEELPLSVSWRLGLGKRLSLRVLCSQDYVFSIDSLVSDLLMVVPGLVICGVRNILECSWVGFQVQSVSQSVSLQ